MANDSVLSVGNLIPIKGHDLLLRSIAAIAPGHPHLQCRIIGDGPERGRLQQLARELRIEDRVQFLARRPRSEVAAAMQDCTLFALPSWYEGLGCVYLEAMSVERPAIACRGQGIEEVIRHGENGWLVGPNNLDDLTNALRELTLRPAFAGETRLQRPANRAARLHSGTSGKEAVVDLPGVPGMKRRLLITTEIISPYRIPVFGALAQHPDVDLHVIFLAETDPTMRRWKIYKDEIHFSYEVLPHWRRRVAGYNFLLNRGVASALERAQPDVIVCGGYGYLANWQAMVWARQHNRPVFLWSESNQQDQRRGMPHVEMLKRRFVAACSGFVVPGKSAAAYVASFGVPGGRIFAAPNAVDNAFFAREASAARSRVFEMRHQFGLPDRYFLYVGRLVFSKGVFDLLDAYSELPPEVRAEVGLLFVGDGVEQPELEARARAIHSGTVRFAGFAHREQLAVYYALAEALVFPTHTDPWGLVVNEAMACGIPIIATDAGGCVVDLVQDGWNGYVVPKSAPEKLAEALTKVAASPELNTAMGTRSAQRIEQNSPQACAAGFVAGMNSVEIRAV